MQKILILIVILLFSNNVYSQNFEQYKLPSDKQFYELRMSILNDSTYNAYARYPQKEEIYTLMESEPEKFIEEAEKWLIKFPADMNILYAISFAHRRLDNFSEYAKRFHQYLGLVSSVLTSGDGKTCETAFKVISTSEEYTILNELGLKMESQALVGGCDLMTCTDRNGKEVKLYFDVSKLFENMKSLFKENPKTDSLKRD